MMGDIYACILANASDRSQALAIYQRETERIRRAFESARRLRDIRTVLSVAAGNLRTVSLKRDLRETPFVLLTGEIFVRHDDLSRQGLIERLADQGFAAKVSSVMEWIYYADWCYLNGLAAQEAGLRDRCSLLFRSWWMRHSESALKHIMSRSSLLAYRRENVAQTIKNARPFLNPALTGEAVLTIGASISEIFDHYCGVIALGPFGCMPNRLSESILTPAMNKGHLPAVKNHRRRSHIPEAIHDLPFLAIESDGKPFPQMITAKLEVFLLQAKRMHQAMSGA